MPDAIIEQPAALPGSSNPGDYEAERTSFSWDAARVQLDDLVAFLDTHGASAG